jgi:cysteinyl-tRNA synthetase
MALRVYNTLTRTKEEFRTVRPGEVGMYLCGPTVYKPSHIGHMVGPVVFDTVKRYLVYLGYKVHWVVNITDVEDKLIKRAAELGTTVKDLAERMTADYLGCLRWLNVTGIDRMPKATEHIGEMIEMMQGLITNGHAYASGGDVYFDVTRDPDYGKLCNRDPEQLEAGARIEVSDKKRNPGDFTLWKGAKPGEPAWDSPWGPGRPGWHIECSAMSLKHLGRTLDIHGGGLDLQFPHHENELAQSESYTGQTFSNFWMHNGLLRLGRTKMAGSIGNVLNIADLMPRVPGEVVRFFLIATHYRSPIDLGDFDPATQDLPAGIIQAQKAYDAFSRFFERYQRVTGAGFHELPAAERRGPFDAGSSEFLAEVGGLRERFLECMDDDFNTGGAVGVLYELLTALNRFADARQLEGGKPAAEDVAEFRRGVLVLRELGSVLGLFREPATLSRGGDDKLVNGLLQLLVDLRDHLRAEARKIESKDAKKLLFDQADRIRKRLNELGVTLEDRPGGTGWRLS